MQTIVDCLYLNLHWELEVTKVTALKLFRKIRGKRMQQSEYVTKLKQ